MVALRCRPDGRRAIRFMTLRSRFQPATFPARRCDPSDAGRHPRRIPRARPGADGRRDVLGLGCVRQTCARKRGRRAGPADVSQHSWHRPHFPLVAAWQRRRRAVAEREMDCIGARRAAHRQSVLPLQGDRAHCGVDCNPDLFHLPAADRHSRRHDGHRPPDRDRRHDGACRIPRPRPHRWREPVGPCGGRSSCGGRRCAVPDRDAAHHPCDPQRHRRATCHLVHLVVVNAGVRRIVDMEFELAVAARRPRMGGVPRHRLHHHGCNPRALRVDGADRAVPHGAVYESGAADDGGA